MATRNVSEGRIWFGLRWLAVRPSLTLRVSIASGMVQLLTITNRFGLHCFGSILIDSKRLGDATTHESGTVQLGRVDRQTLIMRRNAAPLTTSVANARL